jgi:hypothetical protein
MNRSKTYLLIAAGAAILAASFAFLGLVKVPGPPVESSPVCTVPEEPFQKQVTISFTAGRLEGFGSFQVPSGKRLVVEHVSARVALPNGQRIIESRIETLQAGGGAMARHYLTAHVEGSRPGAGDYFSVSQDMRLYAVGAVRFGFFRTSDSNVGLVNATVSGYLVDL